MLTLHERTDEGLSDCIHSRVTNDLHVYGTLAHTELPLRQTCMVSDFVVGFMSKVTERT